MNTVMPIGIDDFAEARQRYYLRETGTTYNEAMALRIIHDAQETFLPLFETLQQELANNWVMA
ncbi:MAG: hypothetical protein SOZ01_08360 [Selenomonadaceae bacterium]|nr:hypothetical protein [Selenomonadaceae bacterium]MDY3916728.1 hypothetical protein [Selenomonadaceae bacterium]